MYVKFLIELTKDFYDKKVFGLKWNFYRINNRTHLACSKISFFYRIRVKKLNVTNKKGFLCCTRDFSNLNLFYFITKKDEKA